MREARSAARNAVLTKHSSRGELCDGGEIDPLESWIAEDDGRLVRRFTSVDYEGMLEWLIAQASSSIVEIPYRQNRATVFPARLFRESVEADFREGFEHMRIGLTFEFGRLETT